MVNILQTHVSFHLIPLRLGLSLNLEPGCHQASIGDSTVSASCSTEVTGACSFAPGFSFFMFITFLFVLWGRDYMHATVVGGQFLKISSLHHVGPRDPAQVIGLCSRHLHLLSHLSGPTFSILLCVLES